MNMKKYSLLPIVAGSSLFVLSSCKNPADETADATVTEAAPEAIVSGGTTYAFIEDSSISFVGSKVTGSHDGGFKSFTGSFVVKDGEPQGGEFTIDMDSTWSDNDKLTEHLKAPDFFNVAKFPESKFVATGFEKKGENSYHLSGNLTLHGVTKNITFPTTVETSGEMVSVKSEFDIKRGDFGITYEGKKDDLIRDEVVIKLALEAKPES